MAGPVLWDRNYQKVSPFPADGLFYLPLAHKYRNESPGSHEDDSK